MSFHAPCRATLVAAVVIACATFMHAVSPSMANASATGELIWIEPLDPARSFAAAGPSFEIMYSTKNQRDAPAEASGALYVPAGLAPAGGWPLVVWAHGTAGIGDACAPSRLPLTRSVSGYFNQIHGISAAEKMGHHWPIGRG